MATCTIDTVEGKFVACGGIDGKIYVYQFNTENKRKVKDSTIKMIMPRHEFQGHQSLVTCSGFMGTSHVISGSDDSDIILWDFERPGRYLVKYSEHYNEISCLDVFNRDGNVFASGSTDAAVRIWDIRMRQPCIRVFDKNKCGISAVRFMPDK